MFCVKNNSVILWQWQNNAVSKRHVHTNICELGYIE